MTRRPIVSDHAVLRYLERAHGLDVQFFRDHIADLTARGVEHGAIAVGIEGVKFILDGAVVVTTLGRHARVRRTSRGAAD